MGFTSDILHSNRKGKVRHGSVHKPVHHSVSFSFDDARELAYVFQGKKSGYSYGRQVNPTVTALQEKIDLMEKSYETIAFGTGMAAIGSTIFSLLRPGDHFISSSFLFGNTNSLFQSFMSHGIETSFVDATCAENVRAEIKQNTKLVFVETIANPRTQISDLEGIGELCKSKGLIYFVDNTLTTPYLYSPITSGANLVINSLTKYIGGHANALGGAVSVFDNFEWRNLSCIDDRYKQGAPVNWIVKQIKKKGLRDFGASLGPEAAHLISVGSDTLALRMDRISSNARALANYLDGHSLVERVHYPGLVSHPQHKRAKKLFSAFGGIFSIEIKDQIDCFDFINRLDLIACASNLGDTRTLCIPVAHSIYHEMGPSRRKEMGIADSLIRFSVGIEEFDDLRLDLERSLI